MAIDDRVEPRGRRILGLVLAAAVVLGAGLAVASYYGWLFGDDLEREREHARRAQEQYARELADKERSWVASKPADGMDGGGGAPAEQRQNPLSVSMSTLSCKEAHKRFAAEGGKARIDADLERRVKRRLSYGKYLQQCRVSHTTKVFICATIIRGVAEGVTVQLTPNDEDDAHCVEEAIRRMSFPEAEEAVVATTRFQ